jgi:hypothetical protein
VSENPSSIQKEVLEKGEINGKREGKGERVSDYPGLEDYENIPNTANQYKIASSNIEVDGGVVSASIV